MNDKIREIMNNLKVVSGLPIEFRARRMYGELIGDKNFCVPLAASILLNISFDRMLNIASELGRRKGKGMSWRLINDMFWVLGFKLVKTNKYLGKTCKTLDISNKGNYLVDMKNHMAAWKGGELKDYSKYSRKRVKGVYRIEERRLNIAANKVLLELLT